MFQRRRSAILAGLAAAVAVVCTSATATADDDDGSAIREISPISFGQVGQPTTGSNTLTLDWQNGQLTMSGSGDGFYLGGSTNGRYQVRGQPNQAATITAELLQFSAEGVIVQEVHLNGESNTHATVFDGYGVTVVRLGGVLSIEPDATAGYHITDLLITVDYE